MPTEASGALQRRTCHSLEEDDGFLPATRLETPTVAVTIDAIALALMGTANKIADNSASYRADSRATPAITDNAANDCAGACSDCSSSLRRRARRQGNNHSNRSNKLSHGVSLCFT